MTEEMPKEIYLEPIECADPYEGQKWCQDDGNYIDKNGLSINGTKFIRFDQYDDALAVIGMMKGALEGMQLYRGRIEHGFNGASYDIGSVEMARLDRVYEAIAALGEFEKL